MRVKIICTVVVVAVLVVAFSAVYFIGTGGDSGADAGGDSGAGFAAGVMIYYHYYDILRVSDRPLFRADGGVNEDVLESLLAILNDPLLDPMLRAVTAEDFSNFVVPEPKNKSQSGAIAIRLFETVPERYGVCHGHLTEFTSQWWQLVYRTADDGSDVLTLWMMQPYRLSVFNGTRYDTRMGYGNERYINRFDGGRDSTWPRLRSRRANTHRSDERIYKGLPACDNFFFEANFSESIIRENLLRDMESLLAQFDIAELLVAPAHLPGQWQSSRYQTGSNFNRVYYASGQFWNNDYFTGSALPDGGLGAAGLIWGRHTRFSLLNGKDGLSVGPLYGQFPHTNISPTHYDLLWLPSDFEIRSMGHSNENAMFQTFIAYPDDPASRLRTNREPETRPDYSAGRSGLWRLNGFDRAYNIDALGLPRGYRTMLSWLRSVDSQGIGIANAVCHAGNRYSHGVHQQGGVRPALHLSVTELVDLLQ